MKKFFSTFFVLMLLVCCGLFYGCGERYDSLSFSLGFVYKKGDANVTRLENGDYRISGSEGTFDDHLDGSYTFYIDSTNDSTATFEVSFSGVPDDFNYGVTFSLSNEILKIDNNTTHTSKGVKKRITAYEPGTTVLTAYSNEGGKKASVVVNVVEVAKGIYFTKNNLAITSVKDSVLSLRQEGLLQLTPLKSSVTKITYNIGKMEDDGITFTEYTNTQLLNFGINFNKNDLTLTTIKNGLGVEDFYVQAVYANPLGDDLIAYTQVRVVKPISEFEIYLGKSRTDVTETNKITTNDIQNLIINIEDLNYIDIILKVHSNGEKVAFNYIKDTNLPVYFRSNGEDNYLQDDKVTDAYYDAETDSYYAKATYTYHYIKVVATKKTTENDNYPDGLYPIKFTCDYDFYTVDNYPLNNIVNIKNDALIKNFSVNNQVLDNLNIVENQAAVEGFYESEIYINSDTAVLGTSLRVDVGNPVSILQENAKYKMSFYNASFEELTSVAEYFKVQRTIGASKDVVNVVNFENEFDKNTTFYLKPNNETNKLNIGDIFYIVLKAVKPETYPTKQACATIKLNVVQGISEFTKYSYEYNSYEVDETTGLYKLDGNNQKIVQTIKKENIEFDATFAGLEELYLDLESGFDATIVLSYIPLGANVKNITITSTDETVIQIIRDENDLVKFYINPISIGKAQVNINTTNLKETYTINVSVYRPITDFTVNLASTNTSYGVGGFELTHDNKNVSSAQVKVNKRIGLALSTLPSTATQYTLEYAVYKTEVLEENLMGTFSIDYNGVASSEITLIGNENFQFDCLRNSFVFIQDNSVGQVYFVIIKLTNLDGSYWSHQVRLSSYVPVESIDTDLTKVSIYNPNTIAYISKDETINDPTAFSLKIETNKKSGRVATYNFDNYGRIIVIVNGITENIFTLRDGVLNPSNNNSLILPINTIVDDNGYYWFKLNENYDYNVITTSVYLSIQIREINYDFTKTESIRIVNAEGVSALTTFSGEQLYYKQGLADETQINLVVQKASAYNKNLIVKSYDILTVNGEDYYAENELASRVVKDLVVEQKENTNEYVLKFTPNNAGLSVLIVMPEDKAITQTQHNYLLKKEYVKVDILETEFYKNTFYYFDDPNYVVAEEYVADTDYYVYTTVLNDATSIWENYLTFYVTVADGIKVPYQISTLDDLYDVSDNAESVTKRYVLTKDIVLDSAKNWEPMGNYYPVSDITDENFYDGTYYTFSEGNYLKQDVFAEGSEYYAFGFNGEFSGKYSYTNVRTGVVIDYYHKISNIAYVGNVAEGVAAFGLFYEIGHNGSVKDLKISYSFFQPTISEDYTFGGLTYVNYGQLLNIEANFENLKLISDKNLIVGGLVAKNYGTVQNLNPTSLGLTGSIYLTIKNKDAKYIVGGLVAENEGIVCGSYDTTKPIVYTYNSAGFDSSLNIMVDSTLDSTIFFADTAIGGAVGSNYGKVKNLSVQGKVIAPNCYSVGGLVGYAHYNEIYNGDILDDVTGDTVRHYSVETSYSIATVEGNDRVGGAIGSAAGNDEHTYVYINNISAENYVSSTNTSRTFVKAVNSVGGLIGYASRANISYSYTVSYFDCNMVEDATYADNNYDIVSKNGSAGSFIANAVNVNITNSSSYVNTKAKQDVGVFIASANAVASQNTFAIGSFYSQENRMTYGISGTGSPTNYWYYVVFNNNSNATIVNSANGETTVEALKNASVSVGWGKNANINDGLPYLTILVNGVYEVLYATTPITILANVKNNNGKYESYIKNDDSSLILFFNYDYLSKYLVNDIQLINLVSLNSFSDLEVYAKTHKTARLNISTNASNVVAINSDGTLRVIGEGKATITVSSKLNTNYKVEIYIVVKYGVNDINLYSNVALTENLKDANSKIELLKSKTQTLYLETTYTRDLQTANDADLKSTNAIGTRFMVKNDTVLSDMLDAVDGKKDNNVSNTINELFKINGLTWFYNSDDELFYVDVPAGANPIITPIKAMDSNYRELTVSYVPILQESFNVTSSTIVLNEFGGEFVLSIIKGATDIIFENNIESKIEISQLQTQTFTVTLFTDYELDAIVDNFDAQNVNGMLIIVKSDLVRNYEDEAETILKSISTTYTINYKDKMTAVENDITYNFEFNASSDVTIKTNLTFIIQGQDKINQVYGTIYANLTDFPQEPEKNNIIYNGNVGVLSVEVYPYFSNYNKMKVYYETPSNYPLLMTQLSYNISGESGELLTDYPESGSVTDYNESMMVEKSSGQDTYLLNNLGTYSYSKIYFFSLLVGSEVPDETQFTVYIEFLTRQNNIIETFAYTFTTIAQPGVEFSFADGLESDEGIYYLPINTDNLMNVKLTNYEGEINWEITSNDYELTQNEIEILTPTLKSDGNYYFKTLQYVSSTANNNIFSTEFIGKKVTITATIVDGQRSYSSSKEVLITMFSVLDIKVQNTTNGYMTLPMSTTMPLQVALSFSYDKALTEQTDNWYSNWYTTWKETNDTNDMLYKYLVACGYEIEENISNYFAQLTSAISKAQFNYEDPSAVKTSGVWFYKEGDEAGYLQTNQSYNDSTFGVELYNEYFAVYGFQIDKNSNMSMRVNLSYTNNEGNIIKNVDANGIPNVYNHNISGDNITYKIDFTIEKDFILNFVYKSDLINAIPISTEEEFINMREGLDYRLVNDIVLSNYTPISTAINTFDGNNYNIYITSFSYTSDYAEKGVLGLFDTVSKDTILYNVKVYYTNKVTMVNDVYVPGVAGLSVSLLNSLTVSFGGIASVNNGTLTNCTVSGRLNLTLNIDVNAGTIADALNGGIAATNSSTGYITNSKVQNFDFNGYGVTGGIVGENSGKIVSCYFNNSSINNLSSNDTAGFVYSNLEGAEIYESYVQGYRLETDNDIRNTGVGVSSKGIVGGFVHTNAGIINDCYSNISLSSSKYISGFVYRDESTSEISRCYSISYKSSSDNSTVASPFAGANSANYTKITINGVLNNCYYLNLSGTWSDLIWESEEQNKQAKGLTLDEFSTHTNFANYDLSLVYNKGFYADNETDYSYVDGYTWVIIEGKPVIVSTLVDTVSQRDYIGKSKNYSDASYIYYDETNPTRIEKVEVALGVDKLRTSYYDNSAGIDVNLLTDDNLLFYTILDNTKSTLTYYFSAHGESETITIMYNVDMEAGEIKDKELIYAEYGNQNPSVLDVRETTGEGTYVEDSNYRANDTIEITYNDKNIISKIYYKVLESASYYYGSNALEISHVTGARTNPQIIYDYESFVFYTTEDNVGKYFRVIRDIDFNYQFTPTAYTVFQGALQGNYMEFNNLSISYLNNNTDVAVDGASNAFGLFATVKTVRTEAAAALVDDEFNTVVSNLKFNIIEVLSNAHNYVGVLAGHLDASDNISNRKIVVNNVSISGMDGNSAYVQGKNAVGGLAGIATGNVIIKDITASVNINATKEMNNGDSSKLLYDSGTNNPITNVAYAGGVIGIFDANKVEDKSTQKNYNANNIAVNGEIVVIGGVVGSAFGLVGPSTTVNYVNTIIENSPKCYLRSIAYAGGIVGENRGTIIGSSITYGEVETYSSVRVGVSSLASINYFYNGNGVDTTIAIGGLVGLNNGGIISNSISSIDVRNKNATVAGGAVGRMIQGKLENVTATGSVISKVIVGGLIGTINDIDMILNAEYNQTSIIMPDFLTGTVKTILANCVAANNWLVSDYIYYTNMLNSGKAVAGFIGLISQSGGSLDFIDYQQGYSYYSNTLYTSSNSTVPQKYLSVAYESQTFDMVTDFETAGLSVLRNSAEEQFVFPYSTREFYYEDTFVGSYYQIKTETNPKYKALPEGDDTNPFARYIYTISSKGQNVSNVDDLYVNIAFDGSEMLDSIKWNYTVADFGTLTHYNDHFGKIYIYDVTEGIYVEVKDEDTFNANKAFNNTDSSQPDYMKTKFYFIDKPVLEEYRVEKRYYTNQADDIFIDSISNTITRYNNYTLTAIDNYNDVDIISINGVQIYVTGGSYTTGVDANGKETRTYTYNALTQQLPNNSIVTNISYVVKQITVADDSIEGSTTYFTIDYIDVSYTYFVNFDFIDYKTTRISNSELRYNLTISSKEVIYNNYIDNGYWEAGSNFLLNADYANANKYLKNLEFSDVYLWETFRASELEEDETTKNLLIDSAEELALYAYYVKNGITDGTKPYAERTLQLTKDIDLSGKYWVPIGTTLHPFKGKIDGKGKINGQDVTFSIKYATINEEVGAEYAGIFGVVENATISNINLTGGEITGKIAGGLVGYVKGNTTRITDISSRNGVVASNYAGGIVGLSDATSLILKNISNSGEVDHKNNPTALETSFGGIVGKAKTLTLENCANKGKVYVFNNKTSYSGSGVLHEVYAGGLTGKVSNGITTNSYNRNEGNVTVNSNAHTLYVGGAFAFTYGSSVLTNVKNYGDLEVNYSNIYSAFNTKQNYSKATVGGIAGNLNNNIKLSGNEGKISFSINTTANAYIGIGGIAGAAQAYKTATAGVVQGITECYNTNNIDVSTISKKTYVAVSGIVGFANTTKTDYHFYVSNSYNSGDIQSDSNSNVYAGGMLGVAVVEQTGTDLRKYKLDKFVAADIKAYAYVQKCLNIGYVNITNISKTTSALGAIASFKNSLLKLADTDANFYLRDAAYSGTTIFNGYTEVVSASTETYEPAGSVGTTGPEKGTFAQLSTTLKNSTTYTNKGWSMSDTGTWIQAYDTWFPSIRSNISSSMWFDKQEELSQEKGSFIVNTPEQLAYLSAKINSGEIDSTNVTIKLTNFVDLANRYWTPIGTDENPFRGTFDGNGFVIRNLTIDGAYLDDTVYGGLFGVVEDATIKNLGLESTIVKNVDNAAAVVCKAVNSTISYVYSDKGNSNSTSVSGKVTAGGLVGLAKNCSLLESNNFTGGIYYSYNNIPVEIVDTYSQGDSYVGGLVGKLENSVIDSSYNNVHGNVKTTQELDPNVAENHYMLIAGIVDKNSSFFNAFSIASSVTTPLDSYECEPKLFVTRYDPGEDVVNVNADKTPMFDELEQKEGLNNKEIWTEEYTLNELVDDVAYPSIRGLGQEWKNTESEALIAIAKEDVDAEVEKLGYASGPKKTLINYYNGKNASLQLEKRTYYLVTSAEELSWISTNVNSGNLLTINCEFILLADIDLSGRYWTPIGANSTYPFQGVFNFNGHKITGLTIDSLSLAYGGLFGNTNGAQIVNGYLENVFIKLKSEDIMTYLYVGSVVGKGYNTTIENISVTTAIAGFSNSGTFVGGIIGSLTGTQDYRIANVKVNQEPKEGDGFDASYIDISSYYYQVVEIRNENDEEIGEIKSKTTNIGGFSSGGNVYAGGVVGYISGYDLTEVENEYLLDVAYNDCNVTAVSTSNAASVYLGGVVGYALEQVKLNNIQNSGYLKTFTYQYDMIGGVVGYMNNGNIQNAYFDGYMESCQDFDNHILSYIGGIVAYMDTEGFIKFCVNEGAINQNDKYADSAIIGGVIGYSTDRFFTEDRMCVYSTDNGFDYAGVGFDSSETDIEVLEEIFTTDFSNINTENEFADSLWSAGKLNSKMIYVTGCGDSFTTQQVDGTDVQVALSTSGKLAINLNMVYLRYGTGSYKTGDKIGIAFIDDEANYKYIEVALSAASDINLGTCLDGHALNSNSITCIVTLISA